MHLNFLERIANTCGPDGTYISNLAIVSQADTVRGDRVRHDIHMPTRLFNLASNTVDLLAIELRCYFYVHVAPFRMHLDVRAPTTSAPVAYFLLPTHCRSR